MSVVITTKLEVRMKKYFGILRKCALFAGADDEDIQSALGCIAPNVMKYSQGEMILRAGERAELIGLMLSGKACIFQEDILGNRNIISQVFKGNLYAEAFALREDNMLSVNVQAEEDCCIMLFDARRILTLCPSACRYHVNLIKNILADLAQKNAVLTEKVSHISQRTTRRKLLSYLSAEARRAGSVDFTIPFDRQQLADYLSVDRSAMSAELSKLKSEGLISYHKNKFTLLE